MQVFWLFTIQWECNWFSGINIWNVSPETWASWGLTHCVHPLCTIAYSHFAGIVPITFVNNQNILVKICRNNLMLENFVWIFPTNTGKQSVWKERWIQHSQLLLQKLGYSFGTVCWANKSQTSKWKFTLKIFEIQALFSQNIWISGSRTCSFCPLRCAAWTPSLGFVPFWNFLKRSCNYYYSY